MKWYYAKDGVSQGPLQQEDIALLAYQGVIKEDTLVWHDGMDRWEAYRAQKDQIGPDERKCHHCLQAFATNELIREGTIWSCPPCYVRVSDSGSPGPTTMAENATPSSLLNCSHCGSSARGNFCQQCGHSLLDSRNCILEAATALLPLDEHFRFIKTAAFLCWSPTLNTLRLFEDRAYRHHFDFLSKSLALLIALTGAEVFATDSVNWAQELVLSLCHIFLFLGATIVSFALLRLFSKKRRTLREFLKASSLICGLGFVWSALLQSVVLLLAFLDSDEHLIKAMENLVFPAIGVLAWVYETRVWSRVCCVSWKRVVACLVVATSFTLCVLAGSLIFICEALGIEWNW